MNTMARVSAARADSRTDRGDGRVVAAAEPRRRPSRRPAGCHGCFGSPRSEPTPAPIGSICRRPLRAALRATRASTPSSRAASARVPVRSRPRAARWCRRRTRGSSRSAACRRPGGSSRSRERPMRSLRCWGRERRGGGLPGRPARDALPEPIDVPPRPLSGRRPDRGLVLCAGPALPVNGMGVRSVPGLFTRNERVVVTIDSDSHGRVAVVLVGAANVGRIQRPSPSSRPTGATRPGASHRRRRSRSSAATRWRRPGLDRRAPACGSAARAGRRTGRARASRTGAVSPRARRLSAAAVLRRGRGQPSAPLKVRPGTLVRWPGEGIEWCAVGASASSRSPGPASCRSTCCAPPVRSSSVASARGGSSRRRRAWGALRLSGAAAHAAALDGGAVAGRPGRASSASAARWRGSGSCAARGASACRSSLHSTRCPRAGTSGTAA